MRTEATDEPDRIRSERPDVDLLGANVGISAHLLCERLPAPGIRLEAFEPFGQ